MTTEDYVSFEIAKLLREKGFDWQCISYYFNEEPDDVQYSFCGETNSTWESRCYSAPTLQLAMKWLREVHGLHIDTFVTYKDGIPHYQWSVDNLKTQDTISETPCCNAYEQACEAAIKYCLENLI